MYCESNDAVCHQRRNAKIIADIESGAPYEDVAREHDIGVARVKQIVFRKERQRQISSGEFVDQQERRHEREELVALRRSQGYTYGAIGAELDISVERARQIYMDWLQRQRRIERDAVERGLSLNATTEWREWFARELKKAIAEQEWWRIHSLERMVRQA